MSTFSRVYRLSFHEFRQFPTIKVFKKHIFIIQIPNKLNFKALQDHDTSEPKIDSAV
jgi:hypothetical protein